MPARPTGLTVHQRQFGRGCQTSSMYVDLGVASWLAQGESLAEGFGLGETGVCVCVSAKAEILCFDC